MKEKTPSLNIQNTAWWRLLKVLYGIGWIITIIITAFTFIAIIPKGNVEESKSSFTCPDGNSFTWDYLDGYYNKNDKIYNPEDHLKAMVSCGLLEDNSTLKTINQLEAFNKTNQTWQIYREKAKAVGYTDKEIDDYLAELNEQEAPSLSPTPVIVSKYNKTVDGDLAGKDEEIRNNPPYKIIWSTDNNLQNWIKSFGLTALVLIISNFILDTIKSSIVFIIIGKSFSYPFLLFIIRMIFKRKSS